MKRDVSSELAALPNTDDFVYAVDDLADTWIADGVGVDSADQIFRFIEEHPCLDYGAPGALVHFLERFPAAGYEGKLVESVGRSPTYVTLGMLNRLINVANDPSRRAALLAVLASVPRNPAASENARDIARDLLRYHGQP